MENSEITERDTSSEFATTPVPPEQQVGWVRVAIISAMVAFSLPTFVAGAEVFLATDNQSGLVAILLGGTLLTFIAALCGSIGARTHLSSYMLTRIAFGTQGAAFVNLAFALSLLGWFGVNIDLFSSASQLIARDVFGAQPPAWLMDLGAGVIMTVTTIYGFKAINTLSMWLVPVLMGVTAILFYQTATDHGLATVLNLEQPQTITLGYAVSSVVGGVIIGAVILPDITRFMRHWRGAVFTALLSYLVVQSIVMLAGGLAADVQGESDFLQVLLVMGLGWAAFVIVIAGSWVLNALNLYSATLSVEATWPRIGTTPLTLLLGAAGTLAAFANILDYFLDFLFYLAVVFVPVAGVIIVDHFVSRPHAYRPEQLATLRGWSPAGLSAWLCGSVVALLGEEGVITLSGMAAVDAIVVSALVYFGLARRSGSVTDKDGN